VKIKGAGAADVQAISGDVSVEDATGAVRLQTVSGNAAVSSASGQPQLQFSSTSGNLSWAGLCGRGCRLTTETVSGDVKLALAPQSSFGLSYVSQSGSVDPGGFDLNIKRRPKKKHGSGGLFEATFGSGEGVIESDAFSGDLHLLRR
jgi:DUF4097 and DUF4098 domain-containing protein YvlB